MKYKKFTRLIIWEFEEFWRSPTLELIIGIAIFFGLSIPAMPSSQALSRANDIEFTAGRLSLFQMFIIAVLFARSIAGAIEKKEILTFFTYPVKRVSILASKFLVDLSIIFIIFAGVIIARGLLAQLEPWNILMVIVLFILFLETMFFSSLPLVLCHHKKNMGFYPLNRNILLHNYVIHAPTGSANKICHPNLQRRGNIQLLNSRLP